MLSKVVNTLIGIKPIYSIMKVAAKQVLVDTANKNGIPWKETVRELQNNPAVLPFSALHMLRSIKQGTCCDLSTIHKVAGYSAREVASAAGVCIERCGGEQGSSVSRVLPAALSCLSQRQSGLAPSL